MPTSATSVLVAANVVMFAIEWFLTQKAGGAGQSAGLFGGISGGVMVRLGGLYGIAVIYQDQWWRLVTAMFLHGGLIHIGFNLWCLFDLGPEVEELFGVSKFVVLYLVTGVFGFAVSLFFGGGLSIGASGAIVGLIGILIGVSFHHGHLGKEYRSMLWRWVIYIFILSLLPGIDIWAHLGGLASGFILGYLIPEGASETRTGENLWNGLAILSVVIIAGSFALMALQINNPILY